VLFKKKKKEEVKMKMMKVGKEEIELGQLTKTRIEPRRKLNSTHNFTHQQQQQNTSPPPASEPSPSPWDSGD
jgi:hypothetical protein